MPTNRTTGPPTGQATESIGLSGATATTSRPPGSEAPHSEPPPAVTDSRYRVESELGRGGMGSVQRVLDTSNGERLALKRLNLEGRAPGRRKRMIALLEQEFHVLSRLCHPRIIRVRDFGTDIDGPYYTMEIVEGQDVSAMAPVPYRKACAIGSDVASSLAVLHNRGYVHRDVTPHNIRWNSRGEAKLLDFGAMSPMGVAAGIAGTPPFVPPEALHRASLDGRADLYSLGATLYYCLTGHHAYPARRLDHLPELWRGALRSPRSIVSETPEALDALVMELLSQRPAGRPATAAAVFERLRTIGELPRDEALEVRNAYLVAPNLVGRESLQASCRAQALEALAGRGAALLLSGEAGAGRTRMLDALALEGKMLGATVLRAGAWDGGEGAAGDVGAVSALLGALSTARPELALPGSQLSSLRARLAAGDLPRSELIETFCAVLLAYAKDHRLLVAVDDVHLLDGRSSAALASLAAQLAGTRLLLVATTDACSGPGSDTGPDTGSDTGGYAAASPAMALLRASSQGMLLLPLGDAEVLQLLRSVFGEVDNLSVLFSVVYPRAGGNPGVVMRLSRALIDAGAIHYHAGAWVLPAVVTELVAALPMDASLAQRIEALRGPALELTALLALDVHRKLRALECQGLLPGLGGDALLGVVDALLQQGLLEQSPQGPVLARTDRADEFQRALPATVAVGAHLTLADWYRDRDHVVAEAHHACCAGELARATDVALSTPDAQLIATWLPDPAGVTTLERLVEKLAQQDTAAAALLRLRTRLLKLCVAGEEWVRLVRVAPPTVVGLAERCGLVDHARLASGEPAERLRLAIEAAEARAAEREARGEAAPGVGLNLMEALQALPGALLALASAAVLAVDTGLVARLPSLSPLFPLSPAYPVVERLVQAIAGVCRGEVAQGLRAIRVAHAELEAGIAGIEADAITELSNFSQGFLQGIEASMARPAILERIAHSRARSEKRAERELCAYYTAVGDLESAGASRARLERMEVEAGLRRHFPTTWETEYSLHLLTLDIEGLRRCERQAREVASELPGWSVRVALASLAREQCGATHAEAIERALKLHESLEPGSNERRYAFYLAATGLADAGRDAECEALAQAEIDRLGREPEWHEGYRIVLAGAQARLGRHAEARDNADLHLAMYTEAGVGGVLCGRQHEDLAYIALRAGDAARFETHAAECAAYYRAGKNPALTRRYEALIRAAGEAALPIAKDVVHAADYSQSLARTQSLSELRSVLRTELGTVLDPPSRFQRILSMLVERSEARGGALYVSLEGGLRRVAEGGTDRPDAGADRDAQALWESHNRADSVCTETVDTADDTADRDGEGERDAPPREGAVRLALLLEPPQVGHRACGVVALRGGRQLVALDDRDALTAVAELLSDEPGVVPVASR